MPVQTVEIDSPKPVQPMAHGPSQWLTPGRFALLLLALMIAAFPDVLLGGKTFFFRDYALFGYPLAHYHREAFWRGEIPLWNPLNNCGIPYLAQWNTMVLYPFSVIYLLLPLPLSLGWFCLFHLFWAGLGMYFLAFRWTSDDVAAGLAGISFGFSGLALSFLIWPHTIAAFGWMPWFLWLSEKAWNRGGAEIGKAGLVGAMQMLTGAPELILLTWVIGGAIWFCQFSGQAGRGKLLLNAAGLAALVGGLCAAQLLPFLDLLRHSQRSGAVSEVTWSMPAWGWANLLVPLFRTTATAAGVQMQPGQGWTSSYYPGVTTLLLALLAVFKSRRPLTLTLGMIAFGSLVLALGDHCYLYAWLRRAIPAVNIMRYPVKIIVASAFCLPLLAASAWAEIAQRRAENWTRPVAAMACALALLILGIVCYSWRFPGANELTMMTMTNGFSRVALLVLVALVLLVGTRLRDVRWQRAARMAMLLTVWIDLMSHAPRLNPTTEADAYRSRSTPRTAMNPRPEMGKARLALSFEAKEQFHTIFVSNPYDSVVGMRAGLYKNCNLIEDLPKVDGFYPLYLPESQEIEFSLYDAKGVRPSLGEFLGVSHVTASNSLLEWQPRQKWLPLITAGQQPVFATAKATMEGLRGDFNPASTVFLEPGARSKIHATNTVEARVGSFTVSPMHVEATVETPAAAIVVIAQTYYHLWRATVDGNPATLLRANRAFQAVEIPAGRHEVKLTYVDTNFRWGAGISSLSFLVCAGLWFRGRRRFGCSPP